MKILVQLLIYSIFLSTNQQVLSKTVCSFETLTISEKERTSIAVGGEYSRRVSYYTTESKADVDIHTLQFYYIGMLGRTHITAQMIDKFKRILKTSPRQCSYCDYKAEEVFEVISNNSQQLLGFELRSLALSKESILSEIQNFYQFIPQLIHTDPYRYFTYAVYFMKCVNEETGEISHERLSQEQIYQYSRTVPKMDFNFRFFLNIAEEEQDRITMIKTYFVRHQDFINFLLSETSLSSQSKIKIALIKSQQFIVADGE
jgi:hypothetical protein